MKIIIIGGRGTPTVIADQIEDARTRCGMNIEVLGLALDDLSGGPSVNGYPILCPIRELHEQYGKYDDVKYIYQLYRMDVLKERSKILYELDFPAEKYCNFIHPSVMIARSVNIGYGNVILCNCSVNTNSRIGNFNTFLYGTHFGHDTTMGNNNFVASQACIGSGLHIGDMNFVGLKATLGNNIHIGNRNIVGQCSNVLKELSDDLTVIGNPAHILKKRA